MMDKILDKVTHDVMMETINKQWTSIDNNTTLIETLKDGMIVVRDNTNKNSDHIRAAQEDINQLYLLFNELIRSNKKDKDDG